MSHAVKQVGHQPTATGTDCHDTRAQTHKPTWAGFVISTPVSGPPCPRPGNPRYRNTHAVNPCYIEDRSWFTGGKEHGKHRQAASPPTLLPARPPARPHSRPPAPRLPRPPGVRVNHVLSVSNQSCCQHCLSRRSRCPPRLSCGHARSKSRGDRVAATDPVRPPHKGPDPIRTPDDR